MSETSFSILSTTQTVKIIPNDIFSTSDNLNAYISIYVSFTFKAPKNESLFDIISISAHLKLQNPQILLSELNVPMGWTIEGDDKNMAFTFNFSLDKRAIHFIEKNRIGDTNMILELIFLSSIKKKTRLHTGEIMFSTVYLAKENSKIAFQIPRSIWVEKILPGLGFRNLKLIEVPLSHSDLQEAYSDIIFEFDKAEHYFNSHDYNKCVAHCRNTLDALTRNLKKIKEESKSEKGFEWLKNISTETFTWIDALNKASSRLTSVSHHAGQKKDFGRQECESIYLVILGLLNFIGNMEI